MNIDLYQTFKLAVELGNFSKVADTLQISAAAVGKQIKTLEDAVGAQLFYRTTRRINLTEFGAAFHEQVCRVLTEYDHANQMIAAYRGKPQGKLKIFCTNYHAESIVIPSIPEFTRKYPAITLDIELGERIPNLENENLDLAIGLMLQYIPDHYLSRYLMQDRYVCVASHDYLKKHGTPKVPDDLSHHQIITHSGRPQPNVLPLKNQAVKVKPTLCVNSIDAMAYCCSEGLGIALLPETAIFTPAFHKNSFVRLLESHMPAPTKVHLYFKQMLYIQPKLRVFVDFIIPKFTNR